MCYNVKYICLTAIVTNLRKLGQTKKGCRYIFFRDNPLSIYRYIALSSQIYLFFITRRSTKVMLSDTIRTVYTPSANDDTSIDMLLLPSAIA